MNTDVVISCTNAESSRAASTVHSNLTRLQLINLARNCATWCIVVDYEMLSSHFVKVQVMKTCVKMPFYGQRGRTNWTFW